MQREEESIVAGWLGEMRPLAAEEAVAAIAAAAPERGIEKLFGRPLTGSLADLEIALRLDG